MARSRRLRQRPARDTKSPKAAGLEPVEIVADVVRRGCITLLRKPEAA